jgi:photosystem II stability/assembly factor-like uncharacterized protein
MKRIRSFPLITCAALVAAQAFAQEPLPEYSIIAPLATQSLLLDSARAGARLVVVGERGHVLTSDDEGKTWAQAKVPTRATLTGVHFVDDKHGWAVGQDEVILRTEDGGSNWQLTHSAPEKEQPLLDVWFKDRDNGRAIGAYGTMLASSDGGRTWEQRTFDPTPLDAPKAKAPVRAAPADEESGEDEYAAGTSASDVHLNAIVQAPGGRLYIAGEAGHLFRSDDYGQTWIVLPSPYEGSFFGILPLDADALLAFGLRGNLFRSNDQGRTWTQIPSGTEAMLTDGARIDEDSLVLSGLAGTLLVSNDDGASFNISQQSDRKGLASVLALDASRFVVAGEGGVRILSP